MVLECPTTPGTFLLVLQYPLPERLSNVQSHKTWSFSVQLFRARSSRVWSPSVQIAGFNSLRVAWFLWGCDLSLSSVWSYRTSPCDGGFDCGEAFTASTSSSIFHVIWALLVFLAACSPSCWWRHTYLSILSLLSTFCILSVLKTKTNKEEQTAIALQTWKKTRSFVKSLTMWIK